MAVVFAAKLWRRAARRPWLRIAGIGIARMLLLRVAWPPGVDLLGLFDPSWFASIRFAGLLRSPGDLLLTAGAVLLVGREILVLLDRVQPKIERAGARFWPLALPAGVILSLLIGSLVGLHWSRVADVARNANVPLFGGFDPFTSAPVAALEGGLLFLGAAFLVWGTALVRMSRALLCRVPPAIAFALIAAAALLASAVKMGDPSAVSSSDFLRPLPALGALAVFFAVRRWRTRGAAAAILAASALAALANFVPLRDGFSARRRELVELRALEHGESPSNARHFLLETSLGSLAESPELRHALEDGPSLEHANLAFILWARSPLASADTGCHVRLLDAAGNAFSTFSLGFPPELVDRRAHRNDGTETEVGFRRDDVGSERVDVYAGRAPALRAGEAIGSVEVSLAYFDRLGQPRDMEDRFPSIFETEDPSEEFLRFSREVPDRVDRYRGEILVASTDPEGGLGYRVPSVIVQALAAAEGGGRWVERKIGGKLYDLYCLRERDGTETVGYLTFGLERHGFTQAASLFVRSFLVTLVLAAGLLGLLMLTPWLDSGTCGSSRSSALRFPRPRDRRIPPGLAASHAVPGRRGTRALRAGEAPSVPRPTGRRSARLARAALAFSRRCRDSRGELGGSPLHPARLLRVRKRFRLLRPSTVSCSSGAMGGCEERLPESRPVSPTSRRARQRRAHLRVLRAHGGISRRVRRGPDGSGPAPT